MKFCLNLAFVALSLAQVRASGATIAAGSNHSIHITSDGTVWAYGANDQGQLGTGNMKDSTTPVLVTGLAGVVAVAAGGNRSIAVKGDGTVWMWGNGSLAPAAVTGLTGVVAVASGDRHSIALKSDGTVWAWGQNMRGQLGNGSIATNTALANPAVVPGLTGVVAVAAGFGTSIALKSDGTVWAWGENDFGQLGNGTLNDSATPVAVTGLTGVMGLSVFTHGMALKNDGTVWSWGYNNNGQLGDGSLKDSATPVAVSGLTGVVTVAAGNGHSIAVKNDGTAWSWGYNGRGQLGNGTFASSITPTVVLGLTGIVAVSASQHNLAVTGDATVWAWGWNEQGQLGNGTTLNLPIPNLVGKPPSLDVPTGVSATPGIGRAVVRFSPPVVPRGGYPITLYTVTANPGGVTNAGPASPITVTGLRNGTSYTFTVKATNALGEGPASLPSAPVLVGPISISAGGIVNAASSVLGSPVSPGSLVSIYGGFPIGTASATTLSWPINLTGLTIQFGGIQAPLSYASPTQANVQVPWELTGATTASLTATADGQTSTAQTVNLAIFAPGVFTMNAAGQGAITDALSGRLISPSTPATAGTTYVTIYCTGLGSVANQPATGSPALSAPLSRTLAVPSVTIGGISADVLFSGLAPGFVGLYQINVQVPAASPIGNTVPVVVSIAGASAKAVTMAVQPAR